MATDEEYEEKLKEKLREEVEEFIQTPNKEELADIKEVLLALYKLYKIDEKEIEK